MALFDLQHCTNSNFFIKTLPKKKKKSETFELSNDEDCSLKVQLTSSLSLLPQMFGLPAFCFFFLSLFSPHRYYQDSLLQCLVLVYMSSMNTYTHVCGSHHPSALDFPPNVTPSHHSGFKTSHFKPDLSFPLKTGSCSSNLFC